MNMMINCEKGSMDVVFTFYYTVGLVGQKKTTKISNATLSEI